jgi:hypothetical protein
MKELKFTLLVMVSIIPCDSCYMVFLHNKFESQVLTNKHIKHEGKIIWWYFFVYVIRKSEIDEAKIVFSLQL